MIYIIFSAPFLLFLKINILSFMDLGFPVIHTWSKVCFQAEFCAVVKQHSVLNAVHPASSNLNTKIWTALDWQGPSSHDICEKA